MEYSHNNDALPLLSLSHTVLFLKVMPSRPTPIYPNCLQLPLLQRGHSVIRCPLSVLISRLGDINLYAR